MENRNVTPSLADIPVLIVTYRRFDMVIRILSRLRDAGFQRVYITIDHFSRDPESFKPVEEYLQQNGFEYQLKKWETNVGLDPNTIEGIHWFFSMEERGIILEDDTIPTAEFAAMAASVVTKMPGENVCFFRMPFANAGKFSYEPLYLPFYWGWYSTRSFFDRFYSFYHREHSLVSIIKDIWDSPFSTRLKLIVLMNYYAHRGRKKGLAWDSDMLLFTLLQRKPFITPTLSAIENVGFGESGTNTWKAPDWYDEMQFAKAGTDFNQPVQSFDPRLNNIFLEAFFRDYTHDVVKLAFTLVKVLLADLMRSKKQNQK